MKDEMEGKCGHDPKLLYMECAECVEWAFEKREADAHAAGRREAFEEAVRLVEGVIGLWPF